MTYEGLEGLLHLMGGGGRFQPASIVTLFWGTREHSETWHRGKNWKWDQARGSVSPLFISTTPLSLHFLCLNHLLAQMKIWLVSFTDGPGATFIYSVPQTTPTQPYQIGAKRHSNQVNCKRFSGKALTKEIPLEGLDWEWYFSCQ